MPTSRTIRIAKWLFSGLGASLIVVAVTMQVKQHEDGRAEHNKLLAERRSRIGDVWAAINKWEAKVRLTIDYARKARSQCNGDSQCWRKVSESDIKPRLAEIRAESGGLFDTLDKSRFWIGKTRYDRYSEYCVTVLRLVVAETKAVPDSEIEELEAKLGQMHEDVEQAAGAMGAELEPQD